MEIEHKIFHDGKVQSLRGVDEDGNEMSVGIMLPGEHDFGIAERREEIKVISGKLTGEGKDNRVYAVDTFTFDVGEHIRFNCLTTVFYSCRFGLRPK